MKFVIVGEHNPYGINPEFALYHLPREASGNRLREHLGLKDATYEAIDKVNLCSRRWNMKEARAAVWDLMVEYDALLLLGSKVRDAFNGPAAWCVLPGDPILLSLPHPSGLCREWNRKMAREDARALLWRYVPHVPWGEAPCGEIW